MDTSCYCGSEYAASASWTSRPLARKEHKCSECGRRIHKGERYENVRGIWEGEFEQFKTCCYCLAMRDYLVERLPCFCPYHGSLLDDINNEITYGFGELPPGVEFHITYLAWARKNEA